MIPGRAPTYLRIVHGLHPPRTLSAAIHQPREGSPDHRWTGDNRPHRVQFPPPALEPPDQDGAYFHLENEAGREKIRFHDYAAIYSRPGLYEQLFYDRLKCQSPRKVADVLHRTLAKNDLTTAGLRVLDLGAGNGMSGEAMGGTGVSRMVGVDILPEAREAALRDRPSVYDHYYVLDITNPGVEAQAELEAWRFDCLLSVAALGFGDIPPEAVARALDLVEEGGWVAFNIKESFLAESDTSGFSTFIRELIFSEYLDLHHLERYRHRFSINGAPLHYFAIVGRKCRRELP